MEYKTLNYNGTTVTLRISSYCNNNRVAIAMYEEWEGHHEQYGVATVNQGVASDRVYSKSMLP